MKDSWEKLISDFDVFEGPIGTMPVTVGSGGAHVYGVTDERGEYIAKIMPLGGNNETLKKQFYKEYRFYKAAFSLKPDFVPEVLYQTETPDALVLVLEKYQPITRSRWDERLTSEAAEVYAKINALDASRFDFLASPPDEPEEKPYPLSVSYEKWIVIARKFPDCVDGKILGEIYERYESIDGIVKVISVPSTVCHGDFHPENCLYDGEKIFVCNWQNANIGCGVGDISFFISRGSDMGIGIDPENFISAYRSALKFYANIDIDTKDILTIISASNLSGSFRFWAEYLQNSSPDRVKKIYDAMIQDYFFLFA